MALVLKDRVKETSTSTGTGDFVLAGAADGFQSFTDALADGDTTYYAIEDGTDWETGLGTWTESTSTLARTTIYESSNSGNAVDWEAGDKNVFITQPAKRAGTIPAYTQISELPTVGLNSGDIAFVSSANRLYLSNGSGWFSVAVVNQTPTVSGNSASYTLANDGTATTVTLTGTDPEGFALTWSATTSGDTSAATVTNVDNVFTITPSTNTSDAGIITVTFRASDGVNIGTASSEFKLQFVHAAWKSVFISLGTSSTNAVGNKTFVDRSSNTHTVTASGSPYQTAFHPYLDSWCTEHTGGTRDGGYFYTNFTSQTGSDGDFTVELWFYRTQSEELYCRPFSIESGTGNAVETWGNSFQLKTTFTNLAQSGLVSSDTGLNKWHHVALTRASGTLRLFIDGEVAATSAQANTYDFNLGHIIFGAVDDNGGYALNKGSKLADIRVINGTAEYTAAFTPPTEPLEETDDTIFMWNGNRIADFSSNDNDVVYGTGNTGTLEIQADNPYGQGSEFASGDNKGAVYLDGSSYLTLGDVSDFNDFSTNKTIQFWIYPITTPASTNSYGLGVSNGTVGTTTLYWAFGVHGTGTGTGTVRFASYQRTAISSSNVIQYNAWNHLAAVYTASDNNITLYLNGTQVATGDHGNAPNFSNAVPAVVGASQGAYLTGYIADLQISDSAVYTTAFTPPTSPVGATGADYYVPMDNAGIFDKTGNVSINAPGSTIVTNTANVKFADSSIYFSGSVSHRIEHDRCNIQANEEFTIEFWAKLTTTEKRTCIFGVGDHSSTDFSLFCQSNGYFKMHPYGGYVASYDFWDNEWHHFAVTRDNAGTVRTFFDGTNILTSTGQSSQTFGTATNSIELGRLKNFAGYNMTGYLEGFQFLKGRCKYASNFSVPTSEQGRTNQVED